jgi:NTP pyrophosphatase (non-canonical NTP hydrolase)
MADNEVEIHVTEEAAVMNTVTEICGEYAKRAGFRQEWEDADWLDLLAEELENEAIEEFRLSGRARSVRLREIAEAHRRMANVQKLMLAVSELSEALGDMRNGKEFGEELADVVIRCMDHAHANHYPLGDIIVRKIDKNEGRPYRHGRQF